MSFSHLNHLLNGITPLSLGAPVPKEPPQVFTGENQTPDKPFPKIDEKKNKYNIDIDAFNELGKQQGPDDKLTIIRDKNGIVAGAMLQQDTSVNYVMGSGVKLSMEGKTLSVAGLKDSGIALVKEDILVVRVAGPSKGTGVKLDAQNANAAVEGPGNNTMMVLTSGHIDVSISEKSESITLIVWPHEKPTHVTVKAPESMVGNSKVTEINPPGPDMDSMASILDLGGTVDLSVLPVYHDGAQLHTSPVNVSIKPQGSKGEGTIDLYKKGVPENQGNIQNAFDAHNKEKAIEKNKEKGKEDSGRIR